MTLMQISRAHLHSPWRTPLYHWDKVLYHLQTETGGLIYPSQVFLYIFVIPTKSRTLTTTGNGNASLCYVFVIPTKSRTLTTTGNGNASLCHITLKGCNIFCSLLKFGLNFVAFLLTGRERGRLGRKKGEETEKGKSYESLETADRRVTSDVPGFPLWVGSG